MPGGLRQWQAGKDIWQQWQQYLTTMATMATIPMCGRIPAVIVLVQPVGYRYPFKCRPHYCHTAHELLHASVMEME